MWKWHLKSESDTIFPPHYIQWSFNNSIIHWWHYCRFWLNPSSFLLPPSGKWMQDCRGLLDKWELNKCTQMGIRINLAEFPCRKSFSVKSFLKSTLSRFHPSNASSKMKYCFISWNIIYYIYYLLYHFMNYCFISFLKSTLSQIHPMHQVRWNTVFYYQIGKLYVTCKVSPLCCTPMFICDNPAWKIWLFIESKLALPV